MTVTRQNARRTGRQRGGISLLWAAVLAGVVALVMMVSLMSVRYERNYFLEGWQRVTGRTAVQHLERSVGNVFTSSDQGTVVRQCRIDGKIMYSNVDCAADEPGRSREVRVYPTQGFEAPKPSVPAAPENSPAFREQVLEKAIRP